MADLEDLHTASAKELVPWFFSMMPKQYFSLVGEETRMFHLRALTALKDTGAAPELTLHNKARKEVTFIRSVTASQCVMGDGQVEVVTSTCC